MMQEAHCDEFIEACRIFIGHIFETKPDATTDDIEFAFNLAMKHGYKKACVDLLRARGVSITDLSEGS